MKSQLKYLLLFTLLTNNVIGQHLIYENPIIHQDFSDPDVIRVGDTYVMTASSFNHVPGLPILISKD